MGYVTEPDGTRVYDNAGRTRYKPKTNRVYRKLKPPDAEARGFAPWQGEWLPPLPVLPEDERVMPHTFGDRDAEHHLFGCLCVMCKDNPYALDRKRRRFFGPHAHSKFGPVLRSE